MEAIEEIKGAITVEAFMDTIGPGAAGLIANHYLVGRVSPYVGKVLPPQWVATGSDVVLGLGLIGAAGLAPPDWKGRLRVAGYVNLALAVVDGLKALGVVGGSHGSSSKAEVTVKKGSQKYL